MVKTTDLVIDEKEAMIEKKDNSLVSSLGME